MATRKVKVNGVRLHLVDEGTGIPVVLLHGFPDSHHLWRHQVPFLVEHGFRVVAPDLRGYGLSDKPQAVEDYLMPHLVADVRGILDELGIDRAHLVGHDWGAILGWNFVAREPDRVISFVAISVGHPKSLGRLNLAQLQRSWYVFLFQFPAVAETLMRAQDWRFFRAWTGSRGDIEKYISDLRRPGRLTAALNWYRANASPQRLLTGARGFPPIKVPVMGVWSSRDLALTEAQMTGSAGFVEGPWRYERIEGVNHWIPYRAPDQLNALLLDFLGSPQRRRSPRRPRPAP